MTRTYTHLGLNRWPFPVVPEPDYCTFLAARSQVRMDVHEMVDALARRETSSIQLFWAWFGAGKTHTVHYFSHYAAQAANAKGNNRLITVYTEFPKGAKSFLDLYRSLLVAIDSDLLTEAFLEVATSPESAGVLRRLMQASPDLFTALNVLVTGNVQSQLLAHRWLRGDAVPASDLKKVGIAQRVTTSEEATRALASIIGMLNVAAQAHGRPAARLIWIIDEFQRIQKAGTRGLDDINSGLHSTFNASPNALTLVFSFSGRPQPSGLPDWFSRELRDRIGRTKVMVLPPMSADEALRFVREILSQFRLAVGSLPSAPFFPFSEATCKAIIAEVQAKGELKPRSVMHAFNSVLQEAEPLIERKELDVISVDFAKKALEAYTVVTDKDLEDGE